MLKIGHSYDCHQLVKNRKLILGGIEIPHDYGLKGHSDADVLLHTIAEAIIGALGMGDLGDHFADTAVENKDIDSKEILKYAKNLLEENKYHINNIDSIIYAQAPKISPFKKTMEKTIAEILKISEKQINIKATTGEKMGFVGRKEGMAAETVCLIDND